MLQPLAGPATTEHPEFKIVEGDLTRWPVGRAAMEHAYSIETRMAEDIAATVAALGEDASVHVYDMTGLGWTMPQVLHFGRAATRRYREQRAAEAGMQAVAEALGEAA
ncbi:hypothetical protein [Methylovirgula sp. 4M-Z18]|uniref:hypothetical protein n=1 Tax=Methylovirgula sp. 4M-Z18 TaxID=2293567 RepID=UPI000E2FAA2E|nr:hypothetical protein [Methylovirgula sp. 4M-Z18]RFB80433.1 hypothetical protein DYH55_02575 [Methylovirgula sp. 4M-Z18]